MKLRLIRKAPYQYIYAIEKKTWHGWYEIAINKHDNAESAIEWFDDFCNNKVDSHGRIIKEWP